MEHAIKSPAGLALVRSFEGFEPKAYKCPAQVWTIGYGRTTNVKPGDTCNRTQAELWLQEEYAAFEAKVASLVKVPLRPSQLGALTSLAYNIGTGALGKSTLLKKLNGGDYAGAHGQFKVWNKGGGKVLSGLVRRRADEAALFLA